jgi:hypothetical protein
MFRARAIGIASVVFVLSAAQAAHAGPKFADYPQRKANECVIKADKLKLVVGIQPMEDLNDQKNYFSMELTRRGLIPVYIVIENQSGDDSFLFDKTAISFAVGVTAGAGPDISSKSLQTLQVASALVISPVGIIVGAKLAKDEAAVQRNLVMKEVQSKTLSPGDSTHGFLYIPVPKDGSRQPIHLKVLVTRSGDDQPFSVDFNF